jgi:hypothetical protein
MLAGTLLQAIKACMQYHHIPKVEAQRVARNDKKSLIRPLYDEHSVTEAVKTVALFDSFLIGFQ